MIVKISYKLGDYILVWIMNKILLFGIRKEFLLIDKKTINNLIKIIVKDMNECFLEEIWGENKFEVKMVNFIVIRKM